MLLFLCGLACCLLLRVWFCTLLSFSSSAKFDFKNFIQNFEVIYVDLKKMKGFS